MSGGRFITQGDVERDQFDWGETGWISRPAFTGSIGAVRHGRHARARRRAPVPPPPRPGGDHLGARGAHRAVARRQDKQELGPGEAVYIEKDVVHGSFTVGDEPAKLTVILSPTAGDGGYEVIDVFEEEPWASLR